MSIIDRQFLDRKIFAFIVKHIAQSIKVRDIDDFVMSFSKYVTLKILMRDEFDLDKIFVVDKIRCQTHVIEKLKINMLMRFDILSSERMIIDYFKKILIIDDCKSMIVSMQITLKDKIKRVIRAHHTITIFALFSIMISIRLRENSDLSIDRDLMFTLYDQIFARFESEREVLAHIIDVNMCAIQINNATIELVIISRNSRLNTVQNYEKESCYIASSKHDHLAVDFNWMKRIFCLRIEALVAHTTTIFNIMIAKISIISMKSFIEQVTSMSITIYDIIETRNQLIAIAKSFLLL